MTLATRCPACGTAFRVVQDQLRVSEGWVRCGRCAEVFNAAEHLLPALPAAADPSSARVLETLAAVASQASAAPPGERRDGEPDEASGTGPASGADQGARDADEDAPLAVPDPNRRRDDDGDDGVQAGAVAATAQTAPPADLRADRDRVPSFVARADAARRWQQPRVRVLLACAAVAAAAGLALQVAVEYRDLVAARWPASRAALEAMCDIAGCRVEAPRVIGALVVDSSGLAREEGTSRYRLNLVVSNRSALDLATPAVDLALTDADGRLVARRTLRPPDLGVEATTIRAGAELPLQATLRIAEPPIAGYTVELFYP
ncbi:MAG: zinc-ribbon domain-containing protein [Rubrivivax sp.]|nr:zinc-ribbon domain-containing protein [Rubrivivax sp.]